MENNQSKSSKLSDSKLVPSSRTAPVDNLNSLLLRLQHYPWLTWIGVWILLLGITVISILSLTHPISLHQEPEPTVATTTEKPSQTSPIPIWLVGATALIATGSFVIFKRLKSASQSAKHKHSFGRSLTRRQQRKIILQAHLAPIQPELLPAPMPVEIPVVTLPLKDSHPLDAGELLAAPDCPDSDLITTYSNTESEPVVTVLPPEEFGVKQESLAEMMDIRKYRSLASILENEE